MLDRLQKFNLQGEEDSGFHLEVGDVKTSQEECQRSLLGKIYGNKVANFTGLKNTLSVMWSFVKPFKIRELGVNFYQFTFDSQQDMIKILHGKAWTFDSQFLVLKPWCDDLETVSFNKV